MRRRRFMRCDRGLRKSMHVAFSGGYPAEVRDAQRRNMGMRTAKPNIGLVRTGGQPPRGNLADRGRWHKHSGSGPVCRQKVAGLEPRRRAEIRAKERRHSVGSAKFGAGRKWGSAEGRKHGAAARKFCAGLGMGYGERFADAESRNEALGRTMDQMSLARD